MEVIINDVRYKSRNQQWFIYEPIPYAARLTDAGNVYSPHKWYECECLNTTEEKTALETWLIVTGEE